MTNSTTSNAEYDEQFMRELEEDLAALPPGFVTLTDESKAYFAEHDGRSELAKQHTKFDELIRELEADPVHSVGLERARLEMQTFFKQSGIRNDKIYAVLRDCLIGEFRDNLEIKAPGPLADATAKALIGAVVSMLHDESITREIPWSTETKVEM